MTVLCLLLEDIFGKALHLDIPLAVNGIERILRESLTFDRGGCRSSSSLRSHEYGISIMNALWLGTSFHFSGPHFPHL